MKIKPTSIKITKLQQSKYCNAWSVTAYHKFGRRTQYCRTRDDARYLKKHLQNKGVEVTLPVEKLIIKILDELKCLKMT